VAITKEKAELIIAELYEGHGILKTLRKYHEGAKEFYIFINADPYLTNAYARAQEVRGELQADEIIEISDTEPDPQKARNRIEARKWYASKMQPKKYGERIDLNVNQTIDLRAALSQAKDRALPADYRRLENVPALPASELMQLMRSNKEAVNSVDSFAIRTVIANQAEQDKSDNVDEAPKGSDADENSSDFVLS
jgi:hypothetical protein